MAKKYVYMFSEGNASMKNLLGGKGANLAEMTKLKLPVPSGFTISTDACLKYYENGEVLGSDVQLQIVNAIKKIEKTTGKKFGDLNNPLLLSVRSGARVSMPGMMDTILNLGLNDISTEGLAKKTNNPRFAYDSYRRFIQMYSNVVMGVDSKNFEHILHKTKESKGVELDTDLDAKDLKQIITKYKQVYKKMLKQDFPQEPLTQLISAVSAVFRSWENPRAITYRRINDIPSNWGTAVNIQTMVFGNMGVTSGTGVAFTRNPATGEKVLFGEYLMNAQGEDVVAGIRTPLPISELKNQNPIIYNQFCEICDLLEKRYKDMQDMEFTIEDGTLYMLQTRNGKRTAMAALQIAVDLVAEGKLNEKQALLSIEPKQLNALLHPTFDPTALKKAKSITKGLPASPGSASGKVVFTSKKAIELAKAKQNILLARSETSPEDIEGMQVVKGVLTASGGMTSHAAVVARGMGTACVAGCGDLTINEKTCSMEVGDTVIKEGDYISIDGSTGYVYLGNIDTVPAGLSENFATIMKWSDKYRKIGVRANADTPKDAQTALDFGAEGIGLCRTEHMFFDEERILSIRQMILAETTEQRQEALAKLLPYQRKDFEALFKIMRNLPVTIRLLDPPLHEFLPSGDKEIKELSKVTNQKIDEIKEKINKLKEFNPMMGHRGCRLSISYPEITVMQTRAIIEASINVFKKQGFIVKPEIMIPLIADVKELIFVKNIIKKTADEIIAKAGVNIEYTIGTMIELPRACLVADELAKEADFFSFGTNDLTQMTFGFSRDDATKYLEDYYKNKIFDSDPFTKIDEVGVGKLVANAITLGKNVNKNIKLGICGEQGGDPVTIDFCYRNGLTYTSCSPFRVAIARLSGAQASIRNESKGK